MLLHQEEVIPEIDIACLVRRGREVLSHERRIDADEMRAFERGTDGEVELGTAAKPDIEAVEAAQGLRPCH
jgi:hypothetical protein